MLNVNALLAVLAKPIAVATGLFIVAMVVVSMGIYEREKGRSMDVFVTVVTARMNDVAFNYLMEHDEFCNQSLVDLEATTYGTYVAVVCENGTHSINADPLLDNWDEAGPPKTAALELIRNVMAQESLSSLSAHLVLDDEFFFLPRVRRVTEEENLGTLGVFLFAPYESILEEYRFDFALVVDLVLVGLALLLVLWIYAYYTGRNEAKAAHSIRGRLATLGNAIDDSGISIEGVKLSYYVEFVDAWIQSFLPTRSRRLPEASLRTVIDKEMLVRTWDIVNGGFVPEKRIDVTCSSRVRVAMREATTMMILDIVLDNARKFATSRISVDVTEEELVCWVSVEDDGAGMGAGKRLLVRMGFGRGLGLFILLQRAAQEGVSVKIAKSELGGVKIRLGLPKA